MLRAAANISLVVFIGLLLTVAGTVTVPRLFGLIPVNITAGSMTGTYDYGTIVLVDPKVTPAVGSVITLKHGANTPVTHRVAAIGPDPSGNGIQYTTRGDFNKTDDAQPTMPNEVIGVVTGSIPYAGLASGLAGKLPVQMFLGCVALALYWASTRKPNVLRATPGLQDDASPS